MCVCVCVCVSILFLWSTLIQTTVLQSFVFYRFEKTSIRPLLWAIWTFIFLKETISVYYHLIFRSTHSSILAWRIPWTEEPGRIQAIGSQIDGHDWSNLAYIHAPSTRTKLFIHHRCLSHQWHCSLEVASTSCSCWDIRCCWQYLF